MDIYSMDVKTSSGSFNIEVSRSDAALQSIIKDLLLKKILNERQATSGKTAKYSEPQSDCVEVPLLYWNSYEKRRMSSSSNQVKVRQTVVEYLSGMVMWVFKDDVLREVAPSFPELKEISVKTYIDGMIAADILERDINNREVVRLSDKFNQQRERAA